MNNVFKRVSIFIILFTLIIFVFAACGDTFGGADDGGLDNNPGDEITRVVIREKSGISSVNYPLTFGHVFRRGDVPQSRSVSVSSGGLSLPSQFDVKSSYPDGSVRHAVISARIPQLPAFGEVTLSLARGGGNPGQGLDRNAILSTDVGAVLELTGLGLTADLREAIIESNQLNYWLRGDVCTEIIVRQDLNNQLNALWEVRLYPGTPYIRISHTIENINLNSRGNVNYALSISQGNENLTEVYSKASFQHNNSSRWRKVLWLGEEPPEIEIRFDLSYMISTGMILPYDTSLEINESAIATYYSTWQRENTDKDIMGSGTIRMYMPEGGGRADIGMLPRWTALYLLTMDNRMREIMLGNGEMSGSIPIHYREDDPGNSFYGRTVSIDDRESFYWLNNNALPSIGEVSRGGWFPDMAHQPSLVYIPYLITGERWFLDELYYWAGFNLYFSQVRSADESFRPGLNRSFGRITGELRAVAWGLRTISDAAAIAYDGDREKAYFKSKLINNMDWYFWRNDAARGHGLNAVIWGGSARNNDWPGGLVFAPWMHDFMVLSVSHIARQHLDIPNAALLRDNIGRFTVNRFRELPTFSAAGYWWPFTDKEEDYYSDGNWTRYWNDIVEMNNTVVRDNFSNQDYAYSYAAIARGAGAMLTHLQNGRDTYNLLQDNLSYNTWARNDPTWAFVPPMR